MVYQGRNVNAGEASRERMPHWSMCPESLKRTGFYFSHFFGQTLIEKAESELR